MPRAGRLALGAIAAALIGAGEPAVAPERLVVVAGLALALIGWVALGAGRSGPTGREVRRAALPAVAGVLVVGCRLVAGYLLAGPSVAPPLPVGVTAFEGTVVTVGSPREGRQRAVVRLATEGEPLVAATLPRYPELMPGDRIGLTGTIRPPSDDDYGRSLTRSGIAGTIMSRELAVRADGSGASRMLEAARRAGGDGLGRVLPEPEAGLASGILIGLREQVARDLAADFTTAGVSHVVAISGWNIAIVGSAVAAITRRRTSRRTRALLTVGAICAYTLGAGASASVVRAATMATVVLVARETGRPGRAATALGWALVVLLAADPRLIRDVGLQLSALATAGLIAWGAPLTGRLRRVGGGRLPGWLAESLGVSLAAQAATLPLILATFGRLSVVAPAANLAVVPLVPVAMATGGVALGAGLLALGGLPAPIATIAALPAWLALTAIVRLVRAAAAVPFASIALEPSAALAGAVASALLLLVLGTDRGRSGLALLRARAGAGGSRSRPGAPHRPTAGGPPARGGSTARGGRPAAASRPHRDLRRLRLPVAALALALAALGTAAAARPDGIVHVVILDVGQGDAILVEGGRGGRLLVDTGGDPERLIAALDRRIAPWDRRLDAVLLTHPHEDHVGGLPLLLERYRVEAVLWSGRRWKGTTAEATAAALRRRGEVPVRVRPGEEIRVDSAVLRVLWPPPERVAAGGDEGRTVNDSSIVLLGESAGGRFLLMGDVEEDVDPALIAAGMPPVALLKVAHHGSRTATSAALLDAVAPRLAAISVGARNDYGHPSPATLERLGARGTAIVRTDRDGTIDVALTPRGLAVRSDRGGRLELAERARVANGSARAAPVPSGRWSFPGASTPPASSSRSTPRRGSSATPARSPRSRHGSRNGRAGARARRSTAGSSRPPPCSTTSTSCRRSGGSRPSRASPTARGRRHG